MSRLPYHVHFGWCREDWREFATFPEALAYYKTVRDASFVNLDGYDCDCVGDPLEYVMCSDGLTDEEKEAIEQADYVVARFDRLRTRARQRLIETGVALFKAPAWSTAELEAMAVIEMARRRSPQLVEQALDEAMREVDPGAWDRWRG